MARLGISVTKSTLFRGVQQEFSNVYHYQGVAGTGGSPANKLAEVVDRERAIHSLQVNFIRGAVWTADGTPAQNEMLYQEELTGAGLAAGIGNVDRERAFLFRWPAGVDIRGKPVFLRKWYHTCGSFGMGGTLNYPPGMTQLENTAEIPVASRTDMANFVSGFNEIGGMENWSLCSRGGRVWQGQPECHPYFEHHQLGDAWRG